ncbi:uncharacterized protein B0T23DRAFT_194745 [Neurospora hispaniola]|uniref:Uncharacterized protein n=1 Tax=Neurospora hispaniola TaxID=588809 RepID=A0AAJ0MPE1_9PEZI|nr:hypothetical protein B0T23DRAFT_194745 [Neurospora hispaniola]
MLYRSVDHFQSQLNPARSPSAQEFRKSASTERPSFPKAREVVSHTPFVMFIFTSPCDPRSKTFVLFARMHRWCCAPSPFLHPLSTAVSIWKRTYLVSATTFTTSADELSVNEPCILENFSSLTRSALPSGSLDTLFLSSHVSSCLLQCIFPLHQTSGSTRTVLLFHCRDLILLAFSPICQRASSVLILSSRPQKRSISTNLPMPSVINNEMATHDDESSLSFSTESSIGMFSPSYTVDLYMVQLSLPTTRRRTGSGFDVCLVKEKNKRKQSP